MKRGISLAPYPRHHQAMGTASPAGHGVPPSPGPPADPITHPMAMGGMWGLSGAGVGVREELPSRQGWRWP